MLGESVREVSFRLFGGGRMHENFGETLHL